MTSCSCLLWLYPENKFILCCLQIIDPRMSSEEADIGGGVYIPQPPNSVLDLRPSDDSHLVLFFDARRTWYVPKGGVLWVDEHLHWFFL